MSINELLNDLKETYSFSSVTCSQKPDDAMTDFVFYLTQDQITKVIEKASRLNSIVESCANMISICEPELKETLMATTLLSSLYSTDSIARIFLKIRILKKLS